MSATTVLEADGLTKRFGGVRAVERLTLEVSQGEVFGFLGPNGAGKTTTIRLLLDFLRPTRGRASVLGCDPGEHEVRRRIGYLPAELRIDPRYTASDVVAFFGDLRGGVDQAYVSALLEQFDLDPARPLGELSTGNKRKIGIVQAFMHRPELLLLDEPTSGLDPLLQHEFASLVRESAAGGATVFLSSHVLPEVELLAERVGIMRRGELVSTDRIEALRARARQRIDLHLAGPADAQAFRSLPGVVEAEAVDSTVHLVVEGSVDAVVKAAAAFTVLRVVTHDADLEDVFLSYYRDES